MTKLEMKEIRKALATVGTKFTIENDRMLANTTFVVGEGYITTDSVFGRSMNISYVGATKMDLYTFDMLCKKSTGTIFFKDVTIINA
jgi:hypothetical protein